MATKDFYERLSMLGFPILEGDSQQTTNATLAEVIKSKIFVSGRDFLLCWQTASKNNGSIIRK